MAAALQKAVEWLGTVRRPWSRLGPLRLVFLVLGALSVVAYAVAVVRGETGPRSTLGLGAGIAAVVLLVLVMLYSIRRSLPAVRRLGRTHPYLVLHVQGGAVFFLLFLIHTDFGLPAGVLTTTLWLLTLWVVVTGGIGILLQRSVPRLLDLGASVEVHLDRVPELVEDVRERATDLAEAAGPRVGAFYQRELAADLAEPRARPGLLLKRLRSGGDRTNEFDLLERTLEGDALSAAQELRELHRTKLDMDIHYTLQRLMRTWLYVHLPAAIVMLGLVVLHVFFIMYF